MRLWIRYGITLLFGLYAAVWDVRTRTIPVWPALIVCAAGLAAHGLIPGWYIEDSFFGAMIGGTLCLFSLASKGQIGMGDGIVMAALGAWLGFWTAARVLLYALMAAALWSVVLLVRRKGIGAQFPFVPCLLAAEAAAIVWQ